MKDISALINCLPSPRHKNGALDWAFWTGALIEAMQDSGASNDDIFETFLWEVRQMADAAASRHCKDCFTRSRLISAITEFSEACAALVGVGPRSVPHHSCH
jgi:hypothetical protein